MMRALVFDNTLSFRPRHSEPPVVAGDSLVRVRQAGICATLDEAFDRFLKKNRPAWVPKFKISGLEAVNLIHQAGGLAVMAHPGLNRTDESIPEMVKAGMDGLECFHTKHSTSMTEHYLQIAEAHGLLVTGGSDCHGLSQGKPLIGTVRIPYRLVELMKEKVLRRAVDGGFMIAQPSTSKTS